MSRKKQNVYLEMVQWLETHDSIKPRFQIARDGKRLKTKDMTLEEKRERSLVTRWYYSQEYKAFKACEGISLEELPAEYEQYKEQIATLRRYEQMRKEKAVEKRMRRSVAKQVQNNANTRSELLKVVRQSEEHISELLNN